MEGCNKMGKEHSIQRPSMALEKHPSDRIALYNSDRSKSCTISQRSFKQESYNRSKKSKMFYIKNIPCTQARWIKAHNTKPKTSEQNDCDTKISHDKSLSSEKSIGQKRLAHKDRYKRCLSAYSGEGTTAKVSGIQLRKPAILLQR